MSESQQNQAKTTALRMLAASQKSRNELARKLKNKGYDNALIYDTLNELEEQGLLNDKNFAKDVIAHLVHTKPSGIRKIEFELKRKGITEKVRQACLQELQLEPEDERARSVAEIKWQGSKDLPIEKRKKRLYDFLARRGFDFQVCRDVIEDLEMSETDD